MGSSQSLWSREDLVAATGGTASGKKFEATGVSIDSRTVQPGDVFVALKGPNFDGHSYVADAFKAGAAVAVVSDKPENVSKEMPLLAVANTEQALTHMAQFARARSRATVIGITGSVGKTSVKEMLAFVLAQQEATHATVGNLNNHYGVPLTLARLPKETKYAVVEMGMSNPGEIAPLSRLARPHVAIVTAIAAAHLENFDDMTGIAREKADIAAGLVPDGALVLNRDSSYYAHMVAHAHTVASAKVFGFGENPASDAHLRQCALQAFGSTVLVQMAGQDIVYRLGVSGKHQVLNSLAVLQACVLAGADLPTAMGALSQVSAAKGRGQLVPIETVKGLFNIIDDSYNASPASMNAAFDVLHRAEVTGRRLAVLGDMLELGPSAPGLHAGLLAGLEMAAVDQVYLCGAHMKHLWDVLPDAMKGGYADTAAILAQQVQKNVKADDMVLIKGSFGSRMRDVVDALKGLSQLEGLSQGQVTSQEGACPHAV